MSTQPQQGQGAPPQQNQGRRLFDLTINVQTLVLSLGGVAIAWFSLVGRVQVLEDHDKQQEAHFAQIESALAQQRSDVKEQLRDIGQSVNDTNKKIDDLARQLYQNQAGGRPDIKRWAR